MEEGSRELLCKNFKSASSNPEITAATGRKRLLNQMLSSQGPSTQGKCQGMTWKIKTECRGLGSRVEVEFTTL